MALSRQQVAEVISVVQKDADFCDRVTSNFAALGRDAGGVRNATLLPFGGDMEDPNNPTIKYLCVGIAIRASQVINAAVKRWQLPRVQMGHFASTVDGGHTGCELTMKDGSVYVIDWWQTLLISNPVLFQAADFTNNNFFAVWKLYGTQYRDFKGFA